MPWHAYFLGSYSYTCGFQDLRYIEFREETVMVDEKQEARARTEYWFVDEYGNKQGFDESWECNDVGNTGDLGFFPYYMCQACKLELRSWDEALYHARDDELLSDNETPCL